MTAVLNDISEGPAPEPVNNPNQDRAPKQAQSLGELLRSRREALGMSRQQAAEQLRLLLHWIEAFENNRFDSLVAPVYSRGYLRKYAILLDLPPEEILARYEKLHDIPATPPLAPIKPTASPPIKTSRAPVWLGAAALISVVAVLVLANVDRDSAQSNADAQPPQAVAPLPTLAAAPTAGTEAPAAPSAVASSATTATAALPVSTDAESVSGAAALPSSGSSSSSDAGGAVTPIAEATLTPVSSEPTSAPPGGSSEPAALEAAAPEEPLARLEVPGPRKNGATLNVKLSFKDKSWATVYAADGTRLLYELGRRGRPREISAPPPLTVVVGAIDAVEMRVNDKLVTIPRQPGKDSIKFILDVENTAHDARSAADVGPGG